MATLASGPGSPALLWLVEAVLPAEHGCEQWHFPCCLPRGAVHRGLGTECEHSLPSWAIWLCQAPAAGTGAPTALSAGAQLQGALCWDTNELGEVLMVCLGTGEGQQGVGTASAVNLSL